MMRFSGQNVTCEIATSFWLSLCESAPSQWGPAPGQGHLSGPRPRPSVGGVLGRAGSGAERIASCGENWPHRPTCARPRLGRGAWCVVLCRGRQKWTCGCGHFRARAKAPGSFPPGEWRHSRKTNRSWDVRGKGERGCFSGGGVAFGVKPEETQRRGQRRPPLCRSLAPGWRPSVTVS